MADLDDRRIEPASTPLRQSVRYLKGVGPVRFDQLRRLGIETVRDVLFHFPRSYEDLSAVRPMADLTAGVLTVVEGEVVEINGRELPAGGTVVSVVLSDGRQCLEGVWFHQANAARRFRYGQRLAFSGKPKWYRDHWQMTNPRVQILDQANAASPPGILPVYPLTEDLRAEHLRPIIRHALDVFSEHVEDVLPPSLVELRELPGIQRALRDIHFPRTMPDALAARRRFIYEKYLVLQIGLALRRRELRDRQQAPVLLTSDRIDERIRRLFPFALTEDQDRAVADLRRDLASPRPMQRLLQADVGAGKTAVAVYALLVTVANRHQAALMAPTEVLARQHWHTLEGYLAHSRVRRRLLTGSLGAAQRREVLDAIRQGDVDLVVGTQALVQEDVQFARLGLVVIDEQHKFGVHQRALFRRLGADPHYLVMTATPIPRTVALTVFGDLDVSVIRQPPPGRLPVATRWVLPRRRAYVIEQVRAGLSQGRQAYWVCPLLSEAGPADWMAAEAVYEELRAGPFPNARVALLHGQLPEEQRDEVMRRFRGGDVDILVSTTVVEVGLDVANATLLVVEQAERFGLAQLHQLRGRVSRGAVAGQCYLIAEAASAEAKERLRLLTRTSDGFALAEHDARQRGIGEFFGTRQHGTGEFEVDELFKNWDLLKLARADAFELVRMDSGLRLPQHAGLRAAVLHEYGKTLALAEIG